MLTSDNYFSCHFSFCCCFFAGIRLFFDKKATDDLESRALNHESDYVDIYSNSWGPDDKGFEVTGPGYFTKKALMNGARHVSGYISTLFAAQCSGFSNLWEISSFMTSK